MQCSYACRQLPPHQLRGWLGNGSPPPGWACQPLAVETHSNSDPAHHNSSPSWTSGSYQAADAASMPPGTSATAGTEHLASEVPHQHQRRGPPASSGEAGPGSTGCAGEHGRCHQVRVAGLHPTLASAGSGHRESKPAQQVQPAQPLAYPAAPMEAGMSAAPACSLPPPAQAGPVTEQSASQPASEQLPQLAPAAAQGLGASLQAAPTPLPIRTSAAGRQTSESTISADHAAACHLEQSQQTAPAQQIPFHAVSPGPDQGALTAVSPADQWHLPRMEMRATTLQDAAASQRYQHLAPRSTALAPEPGGQHLPSHQQRDAACQSEEAAQQQQPIREPGPAPGQEGRLACLTAGADQQDPDSPATLRTLLSGYIPQQPGLTAWQHSESAWQCCQQAVTQPWDCGLIALQPGPHWQPRSHASAGASVPAQLQGCPPGFDPGLYHRMRSQIWSYLQAEADSVLTAGTGLVLPRPGPFQMLDLYRAPAVPQVRRCRLCDMQVSCHCTCQDTSNCQTCLKSDLE